jgi:hypothetical protein
VYGWGCLAWGAALPLELTINLPASSAYPPCRGARSPSSSSCRRCRCWPPPAAATCRR